MPRLFVILSFMFLSLSLWAGQGAMYSWQSHLAYGDATEVVDAGSTVYALAGNALFSIDKNTEEITTFSRMDGLHGAVIAHMAYCEREKCLVVFYTDGMIDFIYRSEIIGMSDLVLKQMNVSKSVNSLYLNDSLLYAAMPFGVMTINVHKREIADTYYIAPGGGETDVRRVALTRDNIYALGGQTLYRASKQSNLLDFSNWYAITSLPGTCSDVATYRDSLYIVCDSVLYIWRSNSWTPLSNPDMKVRALRVNGDNLFCFTTVAAYYFTEQRLEALPILSSSQYNVCDAFRQADRTFWIAASSQGVVRVDKEGTQSFRPEGPLLNLPYRIKVANQRLYVVPGERWSSQKDRPGSIMIYDILQQRWTNIPGSDVMRQNGGYEVNDLMNVAVDPFDKEHFFVTSYGTGVYEFQGTKLLKWYHHYNCPLTTAVTTPGEEWHYIRTDAAIFDAQGNIWLINMGNDPVMVASPAQIQAGHQQDYTSWTRLTLYDEQHQVMPVHTAGEMFIDNRHSNWKWIPYVRYMPGLILLDDGGTPFNAQDDRNYFRSSFVDQNDKTITFSSVYAVTQDKQGNIWVAPDKGIFIIPASVDFRTSNACERVIIPRNDGTNLADYLLDNEQVNAICVDGADRKWIGTASSGVFLMSPDGTETIEHFTSENSPLPSDEIISLAMDPVSGKVFIGTAVGLMSYQSDATEPQPEYTEETLYAYPNPVRPDYSGMVTITGLVDQTSVTIMDNGGNVVCRKDANGGAVTWDLRAGDGSRVSSGVYTAFCNAGGKHSLVKILVMN